MFDQSLQKWLAKRFPDIVQNTDTALPIWWPTSAGPLCTIAAAATGSRRLALAGRLLSGAIVALAADIARHRIVPGANDNLSACAVHVALAERLRAEPVSGIRVVLASCGAEEVLQGGIYGFVDRHLSKCDPAKTWVLNLDTIGSPQLILIEGEGPFWMHEYTDESFRDRVAAVAERATGEPLRRGTRARASTDTIIPSRAGYPSTCIGSWEPDTKLLSNYHLMTDTPENLDYASIERAVDIAEALARDLAGGAGSENL
jgi:Zn-dependent M28 family amino/carboxypeptidase